ncbi:hypothetical protein Avbf_04013 [Armadillidium vulgare]|nr:hypothetical protein Avbf_04013 [Armadillidium vulgare]
MLSKIEQEGHITKEEVSNFCSTTKKFCQNALEYLEKWSAPIDDKNDILYTMSNKTVEEKLALYRLRKERENFQEERFSHIKNTVNFFNDGINRFYRLILPDSNIGDKLDAPTEKLLKSENTECHSSNEIENIEFEQEDQDVKSAKNDKFEWIVLILKVALWLILWKIFILLEFGAVYFVCSCFLFIWLNPLFWIKTERTKCLFSF